VVAGWRPGGIANCRCGVSKTVGARNVLNRASGTEALHIVELPQKNPTCLVGCCLLMGQFGLRDEMLCNVACVWHLHAATHVLKVAFHVLESTCNALFLPAVF